MDPNEAVNQLRDMCNRLNNTTGRVEPHDMAEYFTALDTWLSNGGFLPDAWQR